jgi:four helix bundle protein
VPIKGFRDLEVYQEGLDLAPQIYALVEKLPAAEQHGLGDQMKRAAVSIVANIAEGYGKKRSTKDFRAYLDIAIGSANEVIALLDVCEKVGCIGPEQWQEMTEAYTILAKRISTLSDRWQ